METIIYLIISQNGNRMFSDGEEALNHLLKFGGRIIMIKK